MPLCKGLNAASARRAQRHIRREIYGCAHQISFPAGRTTAARAGICQGQPLGAAGECRCSPLPSGVHARILQLGMTGSSSRTLLGGQGQSLQPDLAVAEKRGHHLVQLAGQDGSPGARAVRGCLCPAPPSTPLLQLPCSAGCPSSPRNPAPASSTFRPACEGETGSCAAI